MRRVIYTVVLGVLVLSICYMTRAEELQCGEYKHDISTSTEEKMCEELDAEATARNLTKDNLAAFALQIRYDTMTPREISEAMVSTFNLNLSQYSTPTPKPEPTPNAELAALQKRIRTLILVAPYNKYTPKQWQRHLKCALQGRDCPTGRCK